MEYTYKKKEIFINIIYGYFLLAFTIFLLVMVSRKMIIDWENFKLPKILFAYSFVILFGALTYQNLGVALIRKKYFLLNQEKEVSLDLLRKQIIITNKLTRTNEKISFERVKKVELYYSWNANHFSSDLGYSKIFIDNTYEPIIITQNNINQFEIYKLFKDKITKTIYRFANRI